MKVLLLFCCFFVLGGWGFAQTLERFPADKPQISFILPEGWVVSKQENGGLFACVPQPVLDKVDPKAAENGDYSIRLNFEVIPNFPWATPEDFAATLPEVFKSYGKVQFKPVDQDSMEAVHGMKILRLEGGGERHSDGQHVNLVIWLMLPQSNQNDLNGPSDFFKSGKGVILASLSDTEDADQEYGDDLNLIYSSYKAFHK